MYQRIFSVIQEEMQVWMNDQLAGLLKSLGIEVSQLKEWRAGNRIRPLSTNGIE
jgi:hypothetical protein